MIAGGVLAGVALTGRHRRAVGLEGVQRDQVLVERQRLRRRVPHETVDPVPSSGVASVTFGVGAEHLALVALARRRSEVVRPWPRRPARPVQIDARVGREVGVQRDAQQPALRRGVDRQVSAMPVTAPSTTCFTRPVAFSNTSRSFGPRNAMLVGPVSPWTAGRTSRRASVIVGGVWACAGSPTWRAPQADPNTTARRFTRTSPFAPALLTGETGRHYAGIAARVRVSSRPVDTRLHPAAVDAPHRRENGSRQFIGYRTDWPPPGNAVRPVAGACSDSPLRRWLGAFSIAVRRLVDPARDERLSACRRRSASRIVAAMGCRGALNRSVNAR